MTATRHTLSKNEATGCFWPISSYPRPGECREGTRPCVLRVRRGACVNPRLGTSKHAPPRLPCSHCKHYTAISVSLHSQQITYECQRSMETLPTVRLVWNKIIETTCHNMRVLYTLNENSLLFFLCSDTHNVDSPVWIYRIHFNSFYNTRSSRNDFICPSISGTCGGDCPTPFRDNLQNAGVSALNRTALEV